MSADKERDKLRKKEEKELRDSQKETQSLLASSYVKIDENKKLIKRYTPVVGVGSFICSSCIIDDAKNIIGIENPEILEVKTHEEDNEEINDIAFGALIKIINQKNLGVNFFIVNADNLQENKNPGVLFLGVTLSEMKAEETKAEFFERVRQMFITLGITKDKSEEETEDNHHETYPVNYLIDVCINYTEQEHEDDIDDHEIGFDEGFGEGIDEYYFRTQVALYKMYKNKKLKNLYSFLDDLHNTLHGMDGDEFKRYVKAFNKYIKKEKKKEIEGDD